MDYTNPFSAYNTNYGGAGQQGFVNQSETMETSEKNEMARPFIDMARKGQELDLQKKQTETNEFNSQEQKVMRAKQIMQKSQQADADIARINPQLALDLKKIDNELELSPFELAAKKAQAMEIARNIKGKPIQEFMNAAADFGNAMTKSKADSLTQASSYKDFVDSFKKQHPDTEIPPNMTTWSENLNKYLGLARMSSIYTSAFEQKDIEEKQKLASEEKRTGMTAGATVQAAKITAEQSGENSERIYGSKAESNQRAMADHITSARVKAMDSMGYITAGQGLPQEQQAEAKKQYLQDVEDNAARVYQRYSANKTQAPVNEGDGITLPSKESDMEDGKVYNTPRGKAKWNAKTKMFSPVK